MTGTDQLPGWLRLRLEIEDLEEAMAKCKGEDLRQGKATDAAVCACISLASLQAPMGSDIADIYQYVGTTAMEAQGMKVPEDLILWELTPDQQRTLETMRYEIYKRMSKNNVYLSFVKGHRQKAAS